MAARHEQALKDLYARHEQELAAGGAAPASCTGRSGRGRTAAGAGAEA
jgi:hypothetical protein